jgi:hypothetical protein
VGISLHIFQNFKKQNPMPSRCSLLQKNYQELLTLQGQFSVALTQAIVTGDFSGVALLKAEITEKKQALEGEINPFESALKIREQYETQKQIYERIQLLEKREGMLGMEGIDGVWYPFPSLSEIHRRFRENKEMLDIKTDQGFEKLLIVPFGMSLAKFEKTMEKTILSHYAEMPDPTKPGKMIPDPEKTRLFATKNEATDPDEPLALDKVDPLWVWDKYLDADTKGTLVYFPVVFDADAKIHQGKTKQKLLEDPGQGFQILLIEESPNIPAKNTNEVIGTKQPRKRLEAGDTPKSYLETLQTQPEYSHEEGLTPEAWMTQFLLHLEETDQVIDDWEGNGKLNFNLGGWFPAVYRVARGRWARGGARASLGGDYSKDRNSSDGSRSAVMISWS